MFNEITLEQNRNNAKGRLLLKRPFGWAHPERPERLAYRGVYSRTCNGAISRVEHIHKVVFGSRCPCGGVKPYRLSR
jgi:hypothetical protein